MKIRTLKKFVVARMMFQNRFAVRYFLHPSAPSSTWVGHNELVLHGLADDMFPDAAGVFKCVKVNGGDLVDEFDTLEEAQALVDKHYRGKKAKLMVTYKGEPVVSVMECD